MKSTKAFLLRGYFLLTCGFLYLTETETCDTTTLQCIWWKSPRLREPSLRSNLLKCSLNQTQNRTEVESEARIYRDIIIDKPSDYSDTKNVGLKWEKADNYRLRRQVGSGKFADVYEVSHAKKRIKYAAKIFKDDGFKNESREKKEIKFLTNLKGGPNIIKLKAIVKGMDGHRTAVITEYVDNKAYKTLYRRLSDRDARYYCYELLKALNYSHSMGIIHRDIKPQNVVIDHTQKKLRLIDWGIADFYLPRKKYSTSVATRYYKPPEVVVGYQMYDYSLDMWSFGCLLACMIFQTFPFFKSKKDSEHLKRVVEVLGTEGFFEYLEKYQIDLDPELDEVLGTHSKMPWEKFVNKQNKHLISPEALDLLDKLLCYDHQERLTVVEAMNHPYFYPVLRHQRKNTTQTSNQPPEKLRPEAFMTGMYGLGDRPSLGSGGLGSQLRGNGPNHMLFRAFGDSLIRAHNRVFGNKREFKPFF